ncbi:hypothetical protein CAEBREN_17990 [Caenorhabditis brenneri]|uniref:Uncharacterized protein n=1 Tax=Caenorhabditis brenneri TaxID=135651 RepID=G0NIL9_CAEBE|nr:hypothetical protein CAEBREN_17990 [Caenorhabditis brenneri]
MLHSTWLQNSSHPPIYRRNLLQLPKLHFPRNYLKIGKREHISLSKSYMYSKNHNELLYCLAVDFSEKQRQRERNTELNIYLWSPSFLFFMATSQTVPRFQC